MTMGQRKISNITYGAALSKTTLEKTDASDGISHAALDPAVHVFVLLADEDPLVLASLQLHKA